MPERRPIRGIVSLHAPGLDRLGDYAAALRGGWSPNTTRDVAAEQLAAIAAGPALFVAGLNARGGRIALPDGREVERLPDLSRWIVAEDEPARPFVGAINLRWAEDDDGRPRLALPEHVSGHVGYSLLPAFAGRGYATAALAAMLDEARRIGLPAVEATCDPDNAASRRVIEKNGGRPVEIAEGPEYAAGARLRFIIGLSS